MEDTELGTTLLGDSDATGPASRVDRPALRRGDFLGRYVIVDVLGAGGMGVVYAAYDPELDRRVAIKLLRIEGTGSRSDTRGRGRLIREAQALAKLSHPNVITVHDVGEHEGRVFVAMEFIDGPTLEKWLDGDARTVPEILDVMARAGRGLVAAHAKQMVHRDFKPDNVMLELDPSTARVERVLVMDFGLATPAGPGARDTDDLEMGTSGSLGPPELLANLTRTGAVMGTPAYMAPEQHAGAATDARTDQFAFCVTLYEALYGRRPFEGDTLPQLTANTMRGRVLPPPPKSRVPRWLFDVVARGLTVEPKARWDSMAALLDALTRDPTRARRRIFGLAGVGALIGLGYLGFDLAERQRLAGCEATAAEVDDVYGPEVAQEIRSAFAATGLDFADDTWRRLEPLLQARANEWRSDRYRACADQHLPPRLREVQAECFELTRQAFADDLDELAHAERKTVGSALGASLQRAPTRCLDEPWLRSRPPVPADPDERAELLSIRRDQRRVRTLRRSGSYDEALALAEETLARSEAIDHIALIAFSHLLRGSTLSGLSRPQEAELALEEAFFLARAGGYPATARSAAHKLMTIASQEFNDVRNAKRWARHAETLPEEGRGPLDRADFEMSYGKIDYVEGHYEDAIARFESAWAIYDEHLDPGSPQSLGAVQAIAAAYAEFGKHEEAIETTRGALKLAAEVFGPGAPTTAQLHNTLGAALINRNRLQEARVHIDKAIELFEKNGLERMLGGPLDNLVSITIVSGEPEKALEMAERAVEVRRRTLPKGHPSLGNVLFNYAQVLGDLGRRDESLAAYADALRIYEDGLGKSHPRVGDTLYNIAIAVGEDGDLERALAMYERSLVIRREHLAANHPHLYWSALGVANIALELQRFERARDVLEPFVEPSMDDDALDPVVRALVLGLSGSASTSLGEPARAVELYERAVELSDDPRQAPSNQAELRFGLSRALWEAEGDRQRAVALARQALAQLQDVAEPDDAQLAEIRAWLQTHKA